MKKLIFLVGIVFVVCSQSDVAKAQKRPVKKTATVVATPTATPQPKPTSKAVSPAEGFYHEGLKCDTKDFDCQVSNYTKAINLQLNTKAVFQKRAAAYMGREDFDKAIGDLTKAIELDLNDATGFKARGKAYLGMRRSFPNLQNAIKDFTSATDLEPKDVEAYNLRGSAYLAVGMPDKATADLEKALQIAPGNAETLVNRGNVSLALNELEKAINSYTKAIAINPSGAEAFIARANAYIKQKKTDLAVNDVTKAIEIDPKSDTALAQLAQLFEKERKYGDAIKVYDKLVQIDPKSSIYLHKRSYVALLAKNFTLALSDLAMAVELNPRNARTYELRCIVYYSMRSLERAEEECSKAIFINPASEDAYLYRASTILAEDGDYEAWRIGSKQGYSNMISNASRELAQKPDDVNAYLKRAKGYAYLQDYTKAIEDYRSALLVDPDSDGAYSGRGYVYFQSKKYPEAEADLRKAIELNPQDVSSYILLSGARGAQTPFNSTNISSKMSADGAYDVELFTRGITANPLSPELFMMRGNAYRIGLKDIPKAIADLKKAIELFDTHDGNYLYANNLLAAAYHDVKDDAQAIAQLTSGIERMPDSALAYYHRGSFYRSSLMDSAKAIADFTEGAKVGSDATYRKLNLDAIASIDKLKAEFARIDAETQERIRQGNLAEKARKRAQRNATFSALFGLATQAITQIAQSQSNSTSQSTMPNRQTTTTPTTNPSSESVSSGSGPSPFGGDIFVVPIGPDTCSRGATENVQTCWGGWQSSGYSQIQFRLKGPIADGYNAINDQPNKKSFSWFVDFKNTSNAMVWFPFELIYGDGTIADFKGSGMVIGPGETTRLQSSAIHTFSDSRTLSLRVAGLKSCSNYSTISNGGQKGYHCNEK